MLQYHVDGHADSLLPEGRNWKLVWSDEFDGTELDTSKWDYRLNMMGKRHPAWDVEGVKLDGQSHAVFTIYEKDGKILSSQLQTGHNYFDAPAEGDRNDGGQHWQLGAFKKAKYLKRYGYFECRCRLQKKPGWWSAFWIQSPTIGCCPDAGIAGVEIDVMESFKPGNVIHHSSHDGGYGPDHHQIDAGKGGDMDVNKWHTFGVLWTSEGYSYYMDGELDGYTAGPVSHTPEFILISTEVLGYRMPQHAPVPEAYTALGDTFLVDHVRIFDWE